MQYAREGISALLVTLLAMFSIISPVRVLAEEGAQGVIIAGEVPLRYGSVKIEGYASPNALVLAFWRGSVVGSTTARKDGLFSLVVQGLPQAKNVIEIGMLDAEANHSGTAILEPLIPVAASISVSGVLIPPTIASASGKRWLQTEVHGYAFPGASISLLVNGQVQATDIPVAEDGRWSYLLPLNFPAGSNILQAITRLQTGNTSRASESSLIVTPSGDVDRNGTVDTEDLSNMMYYFAWNVSLDDPREIDGIQPVTGKDVRLLLNQWTGIWR